MRIRPPAVAGMFYPDDPDELVAMVDGMLQQAKVPPIAPRALIAPHAGYIYSGPIAAHAYATLKDRDIQRVILFGPAHRVPLYGLGLPDADAFATPLGTIPLDQTAMAQVASLPGVQINNAAHALEHSLEVHLPFLQRVLPEFTLVPFCVGASTIHDVAGVMDALWDDPKSMIIVSSDLSHYLPYETARQIDAATVDAILALHQPIEHEQACGATPINGLLEHARRYHLKAKLLDYRNSGDTAGDKAQVVGYAAIAFAEQEQ